MAYLYRHIRLDKNEPFYVGIGSDEAYKRAFGVSPRSGFWKKVVAKTEYEVEIMLDDLSWEEACEKEKYFISLYGRRDLGTGRLVNMTSGGEGALNVVISQQTRNIRSENFKRRWKSGGICSPEKFKQNYESIKLKYASGELVQPNKGKKLPEAWRLKISESCKRGIPLTEEHKKKVSEALRLGYATGRLISSRLGAKSQLTKEQSEAKGRKISASKSGHTVSTETRRKISETLKAKHASGELVAVGKQNLGKKMSEETKKNMSAGQRRRQEAIRNKK